MERISDEEISEAKRGHTAIIEPHPSVFEDDRAIRDAQFEADQKDYNKLEKESEARQEIIRRLVAKLEEHKKDCDKYEYTVNFLVNCYGKLLFCSFKGKIC